VARAWPALAVWAGTWLQGLIGYRAWRRLHLATFVVYAAAARRAAASRPLERSAASEV